MPPDQLLEDVANAIRRRQMERTGAGHAFDPDVIPIDAELDNARSALAVALEAAAKVALNMEGADNHDIARAIRALTGK